MKSTGIVRKVDTLRRIVIPIELCRSMDIKHDTPLEIYTDGDSIILKKYTRGCTFCGETEKDMFHFGGQEICSKCKVMIADSLGRI